MRTVPKPAYFQAEWLRFHRDPTHLWVLGAFALLCLMAAGHGWNGAQLRLQAQQQATATTVQKLARMQQELASIPADRPLITQGADPASPAKLAYGDGSFHVGLPPAAGAALALGTSELLAQSIEVSARTRHTQAAHQNITSPALASSGGFDLAFVTIVLLPLAAIALTWRLRAHDRELGTWRLISALPGAARGLFVAGLLLRWAVICIPALAAGALAVFGFAGWSGPAWLAWGGYALVVVLYALFWLVLAGLLNLTTTRSPPLALTLVGLWLVAVFAVPAVVAATGTPLPSRLATIADLRALDAVSRTDGEALEAAYRAKHPEATPGPIAPQKGDHRIRSYSAQQAFDLKAAPIVAAVDAAVARENARVERWSWLSPALAAQVALEHIAGSDLQRHQHFMAQVDTYQTHWRDYFRPMVLAMRNMRAGDYEGIPRFTYTAPASTHSTGLLHTAAAVLAWLLAAAAGVALTRQRRFAAARPPRFPSSPQA